MDDQRVNRHSEATYRPPTPHPMSVTKSKVPKVATTQTVSVPDQSPEREHVKPQQAPIAWYNPRGWSVCKRIVVGAVILAATAGVVAGVVLGAMEGVKANRYPNYTPLNYGLVHAYEGTEFFDQFYYFSAEDPTDGHVIYVNEDTAEALNLTYASESSAVLRVDAFTPNALAGRNSVRIESRATYDTGLFIFDIIHTPYGCGTWPALWLTDGYNWPNNGEIDILESTNGGSHGNDVTLHSTPGCKMNVKRKQTGSPVFKDCENGTNGNAGCSVQGDYTTYGDAMNKKGGGVYALELREAGIRVWYFPRNEVPTDISDSKSIPDPSTWGTAFADFPSTDCDIPSHFRNQSIVANIDLCGELGANPMYYHDMYDCPGTCSDFVAKNPSSFEEAYWEFRSFKVYQAIE